MSVFPLKRNISKLFLRISIFSICAMIILGIVIATVFGESDVLLGQALLITKSISLLFTLVFELSIFILLIDAYYFLKQQNLLSFEKTLFLIFGNAFAAYWFYHKRYSKEKKGTSA